MKMTVCIPVINGLREIMPALALLKYNTSPETEWIIIDNGSTDPIEDYIRKYIKPKRLNFIRNETNPGLNKNRQFAYESMESDILAWFHGDLFVYEKDWDKRIISYFEKMPDLGVVGFFGAQGSMPNGGRIQDVDYQGQQSGWSNMVEAEIHGKRLKEPYHACAIFDDFSMIFSKKMLDQTKGFDQNYKYHHMTDRDASLESLKHGFKNIVADVYCHHVGNLAASNPLYQKWQEETIGNPTDSIEIHNENTKHFEKKWKDVLPLYVQDDFSFRTGPMPFPYVDMGGGFHQHLEYKGDAITKMKWDTDTTK